jgi:hypothetical protein
VEIIVLPLLLSALAMVPGQVSETFYWDFRSGKDLPPLFSYPAKWMTPEVGGLHVNLPAEREALMPQVLVTKFAVSGDFEITARYKIRRAEEPMGGFGVGLTLRIEKARPSVESVTLGRVVRGNGRQVVVWDVGIDAGERKVKYKGGEVPYETMDGRLRLERKGKDLRFLVSQGLSDQFTQVFDTEFGADDVERVLLQAVTSREKKSLDAHWIDLQIQANGLPSYTKSSQNSLSSIAMGAIGIVVLASVGWWMWRRRQPTVH